MAFPDGWKFKLSITISSSYIGSGGVSDFSVLVKIPSTKLNFAKNNRNDVRFSLEQNGTISLPSDYLYKYNNSDYFRVKVPTLSSVIDTVIYCWFGNPQANKVENNETLGRYNAYDENYKLYVHASDLENRLNQNEVAYIDNGEYVESGSPLSNGPAHSDLPGLYTSNGQIHIEFDTPASTLSTSVWMGNVTNNTFASGLFHLSSNTSNAPRVMVVSPNFQYGDNNSYEDSVVQTPLNDYLFLDLIRDPSSNIGTLSYNRSSIVTQDSIDTGVTDGITRIHGVHFPDASTNAIGNFCYFSWHDAVRSDEWRYTEYNNIENIDLLVTTGEVEDVFVPSQYQYRVPIAINKDYILDTIYDFSALIKIENTKLEHAQVDRSDIRFSLDSNGAIRLPCDYLYNWNDMSWFRVKIEQINNIDNTTIYCWFGNTDAQMPEKNSPYGQFNAYGNDVANYTIGTSLTDRTKHERLWQMQGGYFDDYGVSGPTYRSANGAGMRIYVGLETGLAPASISYIGRYTTQGTTLDTVGRSGNPVGYQMRTSNLSGNTHRITFREMLEDGTMSPVSATSNSYSTLELSHYCIRKTPATSELFINGVSEFFIENVKQQSRTIMSFGSEYGANLGVWGYQTHLMVWYKSISNAEINAEYYQTTFPLLFSTTGEVEQMFDTNDVESSFYLWMIA